MTNSLGSYDASRFELRRLREQRQLEAETAEDLRQQAAEDLAEEFGTDVSEWLV